MLLPDLVYFIDRSLGKTVIAGNLRAAGWTVVTMAEFYGSDAVAQEVDDVVWIADAAQAGYPALTCDVKIRRVPDERQAVTDHRLRLFMLPRSDMTGPEQASRFDSHRNAIDKLANADRSGYIEVVYADGPVRMHPGQQ